ncbi:MAG: GatB/YqeY domain-containing protein [Erythrobacter sp.]|nr:GatB/YqeY domain-containing protein [Erythrobacter sp.]RZV34984.1 MAG: GatB/YqeY domain-containing protein [Sphingomonadaceae bacterium]
MLRDKIKAETVTAMKAKDKERTAALRLIGAKIKDRDIELRTSSKQVDDDEMVIEVLQKMAKQRRESITMFDDGGRTELADQERAELTIIEEFLPQMMDEAATRAAIEEAKVTTGAESIKDMGKVMGELKAKHGAVLDMSLASKLVKDSF